MRIEVHQSHPVAFRNQDNFRIRSNGNASHETSSFGSASDKYSMIKCFLAVAFLGLLAASAFPAGNESAPSLLQTLRPGHPRLLVLDEQLASVKEIIKTDPNAKLLYQQLQTEAEKILQEPPLAYAIGGPEHTLLDVSRNVEGRVWLLAGLYRLNGDRRLAARARDEMLTAARFPDWYPKHFLDTAEMTAALGLGYDWLFDYLSPQERLTIRQAMVTKGLDPGIAGLSAEGRLQRLHNNWVQVCNGGLTLGALAIADEEKSKAADLLGLSRAPMTKIMQLFAPDGGFEEGPIYWNYATTYNVFYLAALDSALGTDFGLSQASGFANTGNYRMQSIGPLGKCANFGDAAEQISIAPQMFWLAGKFNHPEYVLHEQEVSKLSSLDRSRFESSRFSIFELLWNHSITGSLAGANLPAGAKFDRIAAAFIRSKWGDSNAVYVGFKGGSNHSSHGHLDLGTFVLDAFGERWAIDLGGDSYGLPGYFGAQRWSYYRLRTEGHNTLTVENQNQDLNAEAPLTAFSSGTDRSFAITDLTAAYPQNLAGWQRGIMLLNQRQVLLQDEVVPRQGADIAWNFHTRATIAITKNAKEATFSQGASKLLARILSPGTAKFEDPPVHLNPPQRPTSGVSDLIIHFPHATTATTITVLFSSPEDSTPAPSIISLKQWQP